MNPALKKKIIYRSLMAMCLGVAVASVVYIAVYIRNYISNKNLNRNISSLYESINTDLLNDYIDSVPGEYTSGDDTASESNKADANALNPAANEYTEHDMLLLAENEGRKRFADFLTLNNDFRGMLIIDGLGIKEPYVHYKDNDKYLNTDFNGNSSNYGTVFLSFSNDPLLTDKNTVFFGHHLRTGAMFTPLLKYKNIETVSEAPVIVLDSLTGKTVWLVFAAYTCEPNYGYIETELNEQGFVELLDEINSRSLFRTNVDVCEEDQIITLSTCAYDFQDARFAVHARKLRNGEEIPEITAQANPSPKPYNVPMQLNLSELPANQTAVMRHPNSLKSYYYQAGENGVEWYVGNTSLIQGPYNCYSEPLEQNSVLSAVYTPNGKTVLAVENLNGINGISFLSSGTPSGVFTTVGKGPVTPKGVNAKNPLFALNGDDLWLLYTVYGDTEQLYRVKVSTNGWFGDEELVVTAPKGTGLKPAGMVWEEGYTLLIWQEASSKSLFGKWLDVDMPENIDNEEAIPGITEPVLFTNTCVADRITVIPLTGGKYRIMTEKNGKLTSDSFDISQIPLPVKPEDNSADTENLNENETGSAETDTEDNSSSLPIIQTDENNPPELPEGSEIEG